MVDEPKSFSDKFKKSPVAEKKPQSFADKHGKNRVSFVDQHKNSSGELVYLVRGKDRGMAAWHYVLVDKMKLPLFLNQIKTGNIDVSLYGDVLYSGWGEDPPEDMVQKIKDQYG